jgi:Xaa-Pro aminopeptidase
MEALSERLQTPISTAELERRWAAVRAAMERDKIDVLLIQNNNDHMGGGVKYFTDLPATNGYPFTVVFPRDDLMTLVSQGPFGGVNNLTAAGDGVRRGAKQWLTTPSFASCKYTVGYDAELAETALAPYAGGTIGLVGTAQMSFALVDYLQKGRFSNTRFVDASDLVDAIKVIKSPEEQELIRRAAAMQDGAMRAAFAAVEPGMRDRDIAAIAQCYSQRHGSENGIYLCASMPADSPRSSASAITRTVSSRKATPSRSWSRIPVLAACTRSWAAPASSARHRPRSKMNSLSRSKPASSISAC